MDTTGCDAECEHVSWESMKDRLSREVPGFAAMLRQARRTVDAERTQHIVRVIRRKPRARRGRRRK